MEEVNSEEVFEKVFHNSPRTWYDLYDICARKCHKLYPTPSDRCHNCPSLRNIMKKTEGKYYNENQYKSMEDSKT